MTKSRKLTDKVKSVGRFVRDKVILPTVFTGIGYFAATNYANAQEIKSNYKNHDIGGKFKEYSTETPDVIEQKVFYNPTTKKEERMVFLWWYSFVNSTS